MDVEHTLLKCDMHVFFFLLRSREYHATGFSSVFPFNTLSKYSRPLPFQVDVINVKHYSGWKKMHFSRYCNMQKKILCTLYHLDIRSMCAGVESKLNPITIKQNLLLLMSFHYDQMQCPQS